MKTCTRCKLTKPVTDFPLRKRRGGNQHLPRLPSSDCRACRNAEAAERMRAMPTEKKTRWVMQWRKNNPDMSAAARARYRRKKGVTPRAEYLAALRANAKPKPPRTSRVVFTPEQRARRARERHHARYKNEIAYVLYHRIKRSMHKHLDSGTQSRRWPQHLGWCMDELRAHLERQFLKGMTWENKGEWHIDHIVPASSFNIARAGDDEFKACWSLGNLRPLWGMDNLSKSDRLFFLC